MPSPDRIPSPRTLRALVLALALPGLLATVYPAARASVDTPAGDPLDVTDDDRRLHAVIDVIAAMDRAWRRNALDRYAELAARLVTLMDAEVESARHRLAVRRRAQADAVLRAEMGAWTGERSAGGIDPDALRQGRRRIDRMQRIRGELARLVEDVADGDTRAGVRTAALADRFLALMRADRGIRVDEVTRRPR